MWQMYPFLILLQNFVTDFLKIRTCDVQFDMASGVVRVGACLYTNTISCVMCIVWDDHTPILVMLIWRGIFHTHRVGQHNNMSVDSVLSSYCKTIISMLLSISWYNIVLQNVTVLKRKSIASKLILVYNNNINWHVVNFLFQYCPTLWARCRPLYWWRCMAILCVMLVIINNSLLSLVHVLVIVSCTCGSYSTIRKRDKQLQVYCVRKWSFIL